jgi:hypothetical protein
MESADDYLETPRGTDMPDLPQQRRHAGAGA